MLDSFWVKPQNWELRSVRWASHWCMGTNYIGALWVNGMESLPVETYSFHMYLKNSSFWFWFAPNWFFVVVLSAYTKPKQGCREKHWLHLTKFQFKTTARETSFLFVVVLPIYLCNTITMRLWGLHRKKKKNNNVKGLLRFLTFWMPFEGQQAPQPSFHVSQETK